MFIKQQDLAINDSVMVSINRLGGTPNIHRVTPDNSQGYPDPQPTES
jgi:hypothetical protein